MERTAIFIQGLNFKVDDRLATTYRLSYTLLSSLETFLTLASSEEKKCKHMVTYLLTFDTIMNDIVI